MVTAQLQPSSPNVTTYLITCTVSFMCLDSTLASLRSTFVIMTADKLGPQKRLTHCFKMDTLGQEGCSNPCRANYSLVDSYRKSGSCFAQLLLQNCQFLHFFRAPQKLPTIIHNLNHLMGSLIRSNIVI